jgi:hypothetical protein
MPDWLVAWDTGITGRLTHCTVCGRPGAARWGVCGTEQHTLGYVLCKAHDSAEGVRQVERLLSARYGAGAPR